MTVKEVMRSPVVTIHQEATIREAIALLSSRRVSGLPVLDGNGNLVGIVTEHDLIVAMLPTYDDIMSTESEFRDPNSMLVRAYQVRDTPVSSIMTKNVVTLNEDDAILKAASTMILRKLKRLPVVRDRKPVGIVSRIDIAEAVLDGNM